MNYKTLNIKGELVSMEITRKTTASGLDTLGWSLHAVSNRGLQLHSFISGCDEGQVWIEAKALVRLRLEIIEQKKKSDLLFERILDLDLEDRKDCLCYFFGAMADRIEDDDIALLDKWIEEKKREREEMIAEKEKDFEASPYYESLKENFPEDLEPVKPNLDRQHEINDRDIHALAAAEELPDLELEESDLTKDIPTEDLLPAMPSLCEFKGKAEDEAVDVSDCCHSEDLIPVTPPLRSSVQSSPDDPYFVCGKCRYKCELITIKRSELE